MSLTVNPPSRLMGRGWLSSEGVSAVHLETCLCCRSQVATPDGLLPTILAVLSLGLRMARKLCSLPRWEVFAGCGAFPVQEGHHAWLRALARWPLTLRSRVKATSSFTSIPS